MQGSLTSNQILSCPDKRNPTRLCNSALRPRRHWTRRQQHALAVRTSAPIWSESSPLDEQIAQLKAENDALRRELAKAQGVPAKQVSYEVDAEQLPSLASPQPAVTDNGVGSVAAPAAPVEVTVEALEAGIRWPSPTESPPFWTRPARDAPLPLGNGAASSPAHRDAKSLHVIHMTAEMAPYAKVGGLGDVVTGLARASLDRGHNVEVMLPFYECLSEDVVADLQHDMDFDCPKGAVFDGQMRMGALQTGVWRGRIDGIPVLLLRPDWGATNIFRGGRIYGGSYNELEAYLYFCRVSGRQPDVLHAHEWQCSAVAMLYWECYHHQGLPRPRLLLTLHNMDNTGECRQDEFAVTGVPGECFATVDRALDERTIGHNPERLCLMKGGLVYSNAVTTVSPTYATEALTGGAAGWLRATLAKPEVRAKFSGVLNGIDTVMWDAARDPHLPANFTPDNLAGKALCKRYLQEGLGLEVAAGAPLVACITRLVPQKGIHLIRHAVYRTVERGGQFVLLGSGHADGDFRAMAEGDFKGHRAARLLVMYSEELAHLIYAAADIVLVPSMFEPCGLTQLIAMRYGAIPVVRATGGLADTVKDVDGHAEGETPNGFTFDGVDEASEDGALDRALRYYRERPQWWAELTAHCMGIESSWDQAAGSYVDIYNSIAAY